MKFIKIRNACEHNLRNVNVDIPRDQFVVVTGVSGSGKSSLAFDTVYAEGQRRYVECLSAYARQFLDMLKKPDVDSIEGLSPAIAIEQKSSGHSPRSTVGTTTEIYDYLRLLFGNLGTPYCPDCHIKIIPQTPQEIVDQVMEKYAEVSALIMAPLIRGQKGEFSTLFEEVKKEGFMRVRIDGQIYRVDELPVLDKKKKHNIDLIVDRITIDQTQIKRITESIELALDKAGGLVTVGTLGPGAIVEYERLFSAKFACKECGFSLQELSARLFSFNSPYGACEKCKGIGKVSEIDINRIVPNPMLSIAEGALKPWQRGELASRKGHSGIYNYYQEQIVSLGDALGFDIHTPWKILPAKAKEVILYGTGDKTFEFTYATDDTFYKKRKTFEGVVNNVLRRLEETKSDYIRMKLSEYFSEHECPACEGKRLKPAALSVQFHDHSIDQLTKLQISQLIEWMDTIELNQFEKQVGAPILREIRKRLNFIHQVGLGYLGLSRELSTLSGGEAQRIRLATQIGSQLVGVIYILDEPSIGLHARDTQKLISTLHDLRDLGNTVLVVEHDEETIREADYILDLGPYAGEHGGEVVFAGPYDELVHSKKSLTASYIRGEMRIKTPEKRRDLAMGSIKVKGASLHNLKNINVEIPLGRLVCVTGVSGSGKSTLINDIVYNHFHNQYYKDKRQVGKHRKIEVDGEISSIIAVDQSPIGRTPRSNPATYIKLFDLIRNIFAELPESKLRGYAKGRFSFNVKGGRCEKCRGDGYIKYQMQFMADVFVECETCHGQRYNRDTLDVKYKGYSIADVLNMTVDEASELFKVYTAISRKLDVLRKVGLGYIRLGQPATTLSGGEAQRIKLARELSKVGKGSTVYFLDEPTTGLHFDDVKKLIEVLQTLVDKGNTVIVIEHNLDVIKCADHIIDLGPEGGDEGGKLLFSGTPEKLIRSRKSFTGQHLKPLMKND